MTDAEARAAAERGAAWLDDKMKPGVWEPRLLAEIRGPYHGKVPRGGGTAWAIEHGFDRPGISGPVENFDASVSAMLATLKAAWLDILRERGFGGAP